MKTVSEATRIALYLTLIWAVIYLSLHAGKTLSTTTTSVQTVVTHADKVLDTVNHAAKTQDDYWTNQAGPQLVKTGRAIRETVDRIRRAADYTSVSLNDPKTGLLPTATSTLSVTTRSVDAMTNHVNASIDTLTKTATGTLNAATGTILEFHDLASDPRIKDSIAHFDETALHLDLMSESGASILKHGDSVAAYYDHRLTSPTGFVKTIGTGLWHLVIPATNIAIAVK